MSGLRRIFFVFTALLLSSAAAFSQDSQDALVNLAAQIAEKRAEVESLSSRLSLIKTDYNEQLRSLATQQADVETSIKREELRLEQIERDMAEFEARLKDNRASMEQIKPVINSAIEDMKIYTANALPFQVSERLAELDSIQLLLDEGRVDAGMILARVWNLIESEYRLTSESGIYRQTIEVEGEQQLVEVARLGMALMYFKSFEGQFGITLPVDGGWEYVYLTDREQINQVELLFDSIRKNIREGYFELPNPMAWQDR